MNKKKLIALLIMTATLTTTITPCIYAKEINLNQKNMIITEEKMIEKVNLKRLDKYVEVNRCLRQFVLKDSAYIYLEKQEIEFIKESIKKSNEFINENNEFSFDINTKSFKQHSKKDMFLASSINKSAYWDWEVFWWGKRVYLHNNCVQDMQEYAYTYDRIVKSNKDVGYRGV